MNRAHQKWLFIFLTLIISIIPTYFLAAQQMDTDERQVLAFEEDSFFIWAEDSATRIDPNFKPIASSDGVNNRVSLSAAKREFESTQIILRSLSNQDLLDVSLSLSPFLNSDGNEVIPVENQSVGLLEIIRGEFFDQITPLEYSNNQFNISEDRNYPVWYTVYVPENTPAGNYESTLTIVSDGVSADIVIALKVYDFEIPLEHTYQSMVNPMTSNLNLMNNFLDHRIDFSGVPMNFTFNSSNFQWTFYWDEWDELTNYTISRGQNQFMISSPKGYVSDFELYGSEYNYSIATFYSQVAAHLRLKGWLGRAYIYYIDEPSVEECKEFEPFCELVHRADPSLRILLTTAPRDEISFLYNDIDIWAPIENELDKYYDNLMQLKDLGKEVVYYPCLFPKTPYANIQVYNQLIDTKVLAWQVFHYNLDGFLYWHVSAYYYNMHGYGYNSWLDGWLIYPRSPEDGIYDSSIRWDALRDGFEDIEYFYKLESLKETRPLYEDEISELLGKMDDIMIDFRSFSDNPDDYISLRNEAGLLIEEILNSP